MSIRNLLVPVATQKECESLLETALVVAKDFNAHVTALHDRGYDDGTFINTDSAGAQRYLNQDSYRQLVRASRLYAREQAEKARSRFDDLIDQMGIPYSEEPKLNGATASWEGATEGEAIVVAERGCIYDLIAVGHHGDDGSAWNPIVESAIFSTRRPVLLAPPLSPDSVGERILIGWNRSPQAGLAVACAMPFLEKAKAVRAYSVSTRAKAGPGPEDIARSLAWHGIDVEVVTAEPDRRSIGEMLLEQAQSFDADLLVMGAYSHNRLREMILGGVTKHVLSHANLPVLMVH